MKKINFIERIDAFFKITKRGSNFSTELLAGFTTFAAMSYILAVNPSILAAAGMDKGGLVTVTALAAAFGCAVMALLANMPIALAPAMGTNTYFAIIICVGMGLKWEEALALTFYNGLIFLAISLSGIREKIVYSVPPCLQIGLQCGIGMFIAFFGLQNAKIVVANPHTLIQLGNFGTIECAFAFAGFALMAILMAKKFKAAIISVILLLTFAAFFIDGKNGTPVAQMPTEIFAMPKGISQTFLQLDWLFPIKNITTILPVLFTLLILDLFDTIGTVVALARQGGLMQKDGKIPNLGKTLVADSTATIFGALLGTSTTGSYVESATGIEAGGKTGLTALVVGAMFLAALFFSPIINAIPSAATAPALIMVGILMMRGIKFLEVDDLAQLVPAVFCMMMIAFSFSITEGFALGLIAYVLLMALTRRAKEIKIMTWFVFAGISFFIALQI